MSHNNHIADRVVQIAARRLDDRDPEVASMAGEIMRLSQNRPPLGNATAYGLPVYQNALLARRLSGQTRPTVGLAAALTGTILDLDKPNSLLDLAEPGAHAPARRG